MPGRLMIWVVAAGGVACAGADPDAAPADEEMTSGAVTALLPLVLFPLLGVRGIEATAPSYAHPLIFLFLGGFLLARAM